MKWLRLLTRLLQYILEVLHNSFLTFIAVVAIGFGVACVMLAIVVFLKQDDILRNIPLVSLKRDIQESGSRRQYQQVYDVHAKAEQSDSQCCVQPSWYGLSEVYHPP
jgi:hypothetical protein